MKILQYPQEICSLRTNLMIHMVANARVVSNLLDSDKKLHQQNTYYFGEEFSRINVQYAKHFLRTMTNLIIGGIISVLEISFLKINCFITFVSIYRPCFQLIKLCSRVGKVSDKYIKVSRLSEKQLAAKLHFLINICQRIWNLPPKNGES